MRRWIEVGAAGLALVTLAAGSSLLAGCPSQTDEQASAPPPSVRAAAFHGAVFGGRQPVVGASVLVLASGASSGVAPSVIGSDVTGSSGRFGPIILSPAPTTGQVIYVVAAGGDAGAGTNSAIKLMTVAGIGGNVLAPLSATVNMNERTTVAGTAALKNYLDFEPCTAFANPAAWSLQGVTSCPALKPVPGTVEMAVAVSNLVDSESGQASAFLTARPDSSPIHTTLEKLDTLASVLAACVNTAGTLADPSATCHSLFAVALGRPRTTLAAAWDIAAWPGVNAKGSALFGLLPESPAFQPVLAAAPTGWTIAGGRFAWASDMGSGKLSAWRLSALTGVLAPVRSGGATACSTPAAPVSPDPANCFAAGDSPSALALGPAGRFLWVVNRNDGTIATWAVDPATGALVREASSLVDDAGPRALAADASGRYLYVANRDGNTVGIDGIDPVTGSLHAVATAAAGSAPSALALSPGGRYLYVANAGGNDISAYAIGANGTLGELAGSPFAAGVGPAGIAVSSDGRHVYVANAGSQDVSVFAVGADGTLNEVAGSPFAAGIEPAFIAAPPNGRFVYVANSGSNDISVFAVGAGGTLASIAGSPFAAGNGPAALAVDDGGSHLYVVNRDSNDVSGWTIAQAATPSGTVAGALVPIELATPFPSGEHTDAVVVDPTGRYVWAANTNCHDPDQPCAGTTGSVSAWRLDPVSGALVPVPGSPFAAGVSPQLLAVSPDAGYVYVADCGDVVGNENGVTAFRVQEASGALDGLGFNPLPPGNCSYGVTVAPGGGYVYTANYLSSSVSVFSRNADGSLNFVQTAPVSGSSALSVAITPDGHYLYVSNNGTGDVSAYALDADTGLPDQEVTGSPFPASSSTDWIAVDPVAPYAYAINFLTDNVTGYKIAGNGALTPLPDSPIAVGVNKRPRAVAVDPFGRYVYTANHTGDDVSAWRIRGDGSLQAVTGSPFPAGDEPLAITVDPSGRYVYTANHTGNNVSAFSIAAGGVLAPVSASSPFPAGSAPTALVIGP